MSTPEPPVTGDEQQPESVTPPAPAQRAPRRTTPNAQPAASDGDSVEPTAKPATARASSPRTPAAKTGAAKPTSAKTGAAKTGAAKSTAAKPDEATTGTAKPTTRTPAARTTARRPATGRSSAKTDGRGDAPSILDTALAAHNASVRESIVTAESEDAPPSPTASAAQQRAARHETTRAQAPADEATAVAPAAEPEPATSDEPALETSVSTQPEADEPVLDAPQSSTAPAEQPTTEQPTFEQPTTEQPTIEQPTTEQPSAAFAAAPPGAPIPPQGDALPQGDGLPPRSVTDFADRLDDTRFFSTLFDFSFTNYVTRKLAGPVYVVGLVLIGLSTLLSIVYSLTSAINTHSFLGAFVFLFGVIITLVGAILAVLLLRVGIEVFVAIIEIAQNTRSRKKPRP